MESWVMMGVDTKGEIYEGLLQTKTSSSRTWKISSVAITLRTVSSARKQGAKKTQKADSVNSLMRK